MTKKDKPRKGYIRITETEIDPRSIFGGREYPPLSVKHHDISPEQHKKIMRRLGIKVEDDGDKNG